MFMCINEEGKVLELKGTETEKNLQKAFEITARRRMEYDIYALIAENKAMKM